MRICRQPNLLTSDETAKIKIYSKVLDILTKFGDTSDQVSTAPLLTENTTRIQTKLPDQEQSSKTIYEPGAALLEVYKADPQANNLPELPVIRTYWKRSLVHNGGFLLPNRVADIGKSKYAARFSFYYEAEVSGKYAFTVLQGSSCGSVVTVGGTNILMAPMGKQSSAQGVCDLKKGFHQVEIVFGCENRHHGGNYYAWQYTFEVKILTPHGFDAVTITPDMMLLKAEGK